MPPFIIEKNQDGDYVFRIHLDPSGAVLTGIPCAHLHSCNHLILAASKYVNHDDHIVRRETPHDFRFYLRNDFGEVIANGGRFDTALARERAISEIREKTSNGAVFQRL